MRTENRSIVGGQDAVPMKFYARVAFYFVLGAALIWMAQERNEWRARAEMCVGSLVH